MWSDKDNQWRDLRIQNNTTPSKYALVKRSAVDSSPYASNFIPLWAYSIAVSLNNSTRSIAAAQSLESSGLVEAGGVLVSLEQSSNQQWDWPNSFACVQSLLFDGLIGTTSPDNLQARSLASTILRRWVKSSLNNFLRDGILNEKNDGRVDTGISGRGGEYSPQVGFGWSIGVAIDFIIHLTNDTENPRNNAWP
jgi:alpha,alpha-trehalase